MAASRCNMLKQILIAEDTLDRAQTLQQAMQTAGVANSFHVVTDGMEAVEYLAGLGPYADRRWFPAPTLLLLALQLRLKSGPQVLEWIRSKPNLQSLPVVMVAQDATFEDLHRCQQIGAKAFLVGRDLQHQIAGLLRQFPEVWRIKKAGP